MITAMFVAMSLMVYPCLSLECNGHHCYGTIQELKNTLIRDKEIVYFLKPCHYVQPCPSMDCLSLLSAGSKLDCKGNVSSVSDASEPWTIPGGISLVPSCKMRQRLIRIGPPSEDVSTLDRISLARVVMEDRQTPCSVLKIIDPHVSVSNLDLDNTQCVSHMPQPMKKTYLSSLVNIYPRHRNLSDVTIDSLNTFGGSVSVHVGSLSKRFPTLTLSKVRILNISGGSLNSELICGDIQVHNVSRWMVQDIPIIPCANTSESINQYGVSDHTSNITSHTVSDNIPDRVSDMMGPLQLTYFHSSIESSQCFGNCTRCYLILVISLLLTVMVITMSCFCYFSTHSDVGSMVESGDLGYDTGVQNCDQTKRIHWKEKDSQ